MSGKKLAIIGGVFIALLAVLIIYFLTRKPGDESREAMSSPRDPTLENMGEGNVPIVSEDPEEALERYTQWAQYPPYSRPLYEGMVDLTDPYNASRPPVSIISTPARGCKSGPDGIPKCETPAVLSDFQCELSPEASVVVGRKDFRVTLRCFNKEGVNLPITGITPKVYRILNRNQYPSLPPIGYGDLGTNGDTKAGDLVYTFMIRPTAEDWGQMYLEVDMDVRGLRHNQRCSWLSTPHIVAEFKTPLRDRLADGHLIVSVPVLIQKAGYFEFQANLQEKGGDGRFIAYATWEGELEAGNQTVEFKFWGKVLKDRGIDGPYVLRQIRGKRNNSPVSPAMVQRAVAEHKEIPEPKTVEPMWEHIVNAPDFETQVYNSSDFSGAVWDSKEKQDRIQFLEEQVKREN